MMGTRDFRWQDTGSVLSSLGPTALEGRHTIRSEARSVSCYGAVRELGVEGAQGAKRLPMSQPGVASAVRRGEMMVRAKAMQMIAWLLNDKWTCPISEEEEMQCIIQDLMVIIMKWDGRWETYSKEITSSSLLNSTHFKPGMAENAGNC
jgi:hypothetical protein